ncbi:DNA topoisomerase II [Salicola phage SCTP-2]|nr:DNA topoisomerase II [Salicola phage SCTP-2]
MTSNYQSQISQHLSPEQHVLQRPNMYLGSTSKETFRQYVFNENKDIEYIPGLLKCVNEIIDNAVDVAIKTNFQYANKIDIEMSSSYVKVKDNGTGMPVVKVKDKDGNDVWNPVLAWTFTNAGTNFSDDSKSERKTIGMHGIGATAACIFSKRFEGETADGKKKIKVISLDNNQQKSETVGRSSKQYTTVYFEPDFQRFDNITQFDENHINVIEDRLHKLAALYPQIKFTFNGESIKYQNTKQYVDTFDKKYVYHQQEDVFVAFAQNNDEEFQFISVVNGLNTPNGGTHIDYIIKQVGDYIKPIVKKKHKVDITTTQLKNHVFPIVFMKNFSNFKSESQTKESLKNTRKEVEDYFAGFDFEKLAKKIVNTEELIMPMIENQLMKIEQANKRKLKQEQKKAHKRNIPKHIAPNSKDYARNILYLVEGDSAKGPFMSVRDKKYHGIYPLKGKLINVRRKKEMEIVENNECKDIMSILGLTIGESAPKKMPYSKIYITADADIDGYCITAQVINFLKFWPELFERKMVYILFTPIIEITKNGKKVKSFYRLEDYRNYTVKKGEKVNYIKGLGSMDENDYKEYLINNPCLSLVEDDDNSEKYLNIAFGEDIEPRKDWLSN